MKRREFLQLSAFGTAQVLAGCATTKTPPSASSPSGNSHVKAFEYDEATLAQLQSVLKSGKETAVSLANKYLERIADIDRHGPKLNSVIELNPDALAIARSLDAERKAKGPRGPLHGIPV